MPYSPKNSRDILKDLVASTVARSELTDVTEGSAMAQILSAVAAELAGSEFRMALIRDSYDLSNVSGDDLDERVAELPLGRVSRLPASAAAGNVLKLGRVAGANGLPEEVTVLSGSTVGRTDNASLVYVLTEDVVFPAAPGLAENQTQTVDNISIVCLTPGTIGNCKTRTINKNISINSDITILEQTSPLVGGQSRETDESLRSRATLYLSSLAKCQPSALEYFARSFVSSDSTRVLYATIYEDRERRGYSELIVDDGSILIEGQEIGTREGRVIEGIVPGGGSLIIFHEGPARNPIGADGVLQKIDDAGNVLSDILPTDYVSIPERGIVYVDDGVFDVGDRYRLSGYRVFTGSLIPELQSAIEGNLDNPVSSPGLRAAGTRVRVLPPSVQPIDFDVMITPLNGVSFVDTGRAVIDACVEFVLSLRPGDTLFVSQLIDRVMDNPNLIDVKFFEKNAQNPGSTPLSDILSAERQVLRPNPDRISIIPPENFDN